MKFLITGGCGFVGSNLIRHLISTTDHHVVNLDKLTYAGNRESLSDLAEHPRYELLVADIADAAQMEKAFTDVAPDSVMHLAAESHVDRSIDGPADFIQTNIVGTFNLLQASLRHFQTLQCDRRDQFRFLHVSTDEVYGSLGESGKFSETSVYDPHSPYAASKASSDHLARAWMTTYGLPLLLTHCSNNYGPYQHPEKLVPCIILNCLGEQPLPVYGDGLNVRDWLYVEDHARALTTVMEEGVPGETYDIGGNVERRNIDLIRAICEIMDDIRPRPSGGKHAELITHVADRPGHDFRYAIDSSKIQRDLNWKPQECIERCLRQTVCWYLENEEWWERVLQHRGNSSVPIDGQQVARISIS